MRWGRGATRRFGCCAGFFFSAARGVFLRAGFFFDAARGFFGGGAHHQRLAFAVFPLTLRFIATVFFQHALAGGEF